jgi:hypothetical protein
MKTAMTIAPMGLRLDQLRLSMVQNFHGSSLTRVPGTHPCKLRCYCRLSGLNRAARQGVRCMRHGDINDRREITGLASVVEAGACGSEIRIFVAIVAPGSSAAVFRS